VPWGDPGVIEQHVYPAEPLSSGFEKRPDSCPIRNIGFDNNTGAAANFTLARGFFERRPAPSA
jgi:hypothetical protein